MRKIIELKNISKETQLVHNENREQVEVKAWATFKTKEQSYLKNYPHLFELVPEKAEKKVEEKKAENSDKKVDEKKSTEKKTK